MNSKSEKTAPQTSGGKAAWALLGAAVLVAGASIGWNILSPPDTLAAPEAAPGAPPSIAELRAAAEAAPQDVSAWRALAFAHFQRREFAQAVSAYERAVQIDPDDASLWAALGETRLYAEDESRPDADPLPQSAMAAFRRAAAIDPSEPRARYFLAVETDLSGNHEEALSAWLALLEDTPTGAPWEPDLIRTIRQVGQINNIDVEERLAKAMQVRLPPIAVAGSGEVAGAAASGTVGGPTQAQIAAAQSLTAEEQQAQIEGMVAMAEAKLADDPSNLDRWVMVMRSHSMLGNAAKAKATLEAAVAANPENEAGLREQARALGIQ